MNPKVLPQSWGLGLQSEPMHLFTKISIEDPRLKLPILLELPAHHYLNTGV